MIKKLLMDIIFVSPEGIDGKIQELNEFLFLISRKNFFSRKEYNNRRFYCDFCKFVHEVNRRIPQMNFDYLVREAFGRNCETTLMYCDSYELNLDRVYEEIFKKPFSLECEKFSPLIYLGCLLIFATNFRHKYDPDFFVTVLERYYFYFSKRSKDDHLGVISEIFDSIISLVENGIFDEVEDPKMDIFFILDEILFQLSERYIFDDNVYLLDEMLRVPDRKNRIFKLKKFSAVLIYRSIVSSYSYLKSEEFEKLLSENAEEITSIVIEGYFDELFDGDDGEYIHEFHSLRNERISSYLFKSWDDFREDLMESVDSVKYYRNSIYNPSFFSKILHPKIRDFDKIKTHIGDVASIVTVRKILFLSRCDPHLTLSLIEEVCLFSMELLQDFILFDRKDIFDVYVKKPRSSFRKILHLEEESFISLMKENQYLSFIKGIVISKK